MQRFGVQLFGLGMGFILFRALTKADVGDWFTFLAAVSILEVGRMGLQQNALIKYLTDCEEEQEYKKIATASLILNFLVTLAIVVILWSAAPYVGAALNSEVMPMMLRTYCITTVLLVPFMQFNYMAQANLDFEGIFWSDFTRQGLLFFYILFMFLFATEITLAELVQFQILTAVAASAIAWFFARPYLRFQREIDWKWVKELFDYGKFTLGTNLSTMLYKSIDKFMIRGIIGPVATASYEAAIKVTNMADIPTNSMAAILFPQSAKRLKEGKEAIKDLYEKAVGAIFSLMIPGIIFVLLFAEYIILFVAGDGYADSANLLRLTILYGLFIPYAVQFGTVLDSIGKPQINFWFTCGGAVLNVILNYVFITSFGVFGAVYGTLLTYALAFVAMQMMLYKMFDIKAWRVFGYSFSFYGQMWGMVREKFDNRNRLKV